MKPVSSLAVMVLLMLLPGCAEREGNSQSGYEIARYKCPEVIEGILVEDDVYPFTVVCTAHYSEAGEVLCYEGGITVTDGLLVPACDPQDRQGEVYVMLIDDDFMTYTYQEFLAGSVPVEDGFPLVTYGSSLDGSRTLTRYKNWVTDEDVLTAGPHTGTDTGWSMKVAWIDSGEQDEQSCMYPAAGVEALSIFPLLQVCDASYRECWEGTWRITDDVLYGGDGTWTTTPCSADEWARINWL